MRKVSRDELPERNDAIYIGKEIVTYNVEVYVEREREQEGNLIMDDQSMTIDFEVGLLACQVNIGEHYHWDETLWTKH